MHLNIFLLPLQQVVKLNIISFVYVLHVTTMCYKTMRISLIKSVTLSVQFWYQISKKYKRAFCRAWLTDVKCARKNWKFARCVCSLKWFYGALSMGTQCVCVCVCLCLIEDKSLQSIVCYHFIIYCVYPSTHALPPQLCARPIWGLFQPFLPSSLPPSLPLSLPLSKIPLLQSKVWNLRS